MSLKRRLKKRKKETLKNNMNSLIKKIIEKIKPVLRDPLCLKKWDSPDHYGHRLEDSNRLSVRVSGSMRRDLYSYNGDAFMFTQDIYAGIMPFMHYRGKREAYPTKVMPANKEKEQMICEGISDRGNAYFIEDALCDFVRKTAQILCTDGIVFYEIIYDKDENGQIESFELETIRSKYFFRFLGNYYQIIPWWEAKRSHVRVQLVKIPKDKILRIDIPLELGGGRKLKRVIKRLWKLSKEIIPIFQMEAMENDKSIGFDMEKFSMAKYLEIAKVTRDFGWSQRQRAESSSITEYYLILRHLRTKKAEALIREKIILELNNTLNGLVLNLGVKVSMDNLFTLRDVEKQEEILKKGNVTFVDIVNAIKLE